MISGIVQDQLLLHSPGRSASVAGWAIVAHEDAGLLLAGLSFRGVREHRAAARANISVSTCRKLYETVRQTEAT